MRQEATWSAVADCFSGGLSCLAAQASAAPTASSTPRRASHACAPRPASTATPECALPSIEPSPSSTPCLSSPRAHLGGPKPLEPEVTSDTAAQFYEVRSPTGETVIARRRLTTRSASASTISTSRQARRIQRARASSFRARTALRRRLRRRRGRDRRDELRQRRPGLRSRARRPDVRLRRGSPLRRRAGSASSSVASTSPTRSAGGRSTAAWCSVTTPFFVAARGLRRPRAARRPRPLSTPRFERDGVWRGDRDGLRPHALPVVPAERRRARVRRRARDARASHWVHGRLDYRRVNNTGDVERLAFASRLRGAGSYDGTRVSQERIGYAIRRHLANARRRQGRVRLRPLQRTLANVYASVDCVRYAEASPQRRLRLSTSRRSTPTRSATSSCRCR